MIHPELIQLFRRIDRLLLLDESYFVDATFMKTIEKLIRLEMPYRFFNLTESRDDLPALWLPLNGYQKPLGLSGDVEALSTYINLAFSSEEFPLVDFTKPLYSYDRPWETTKALSRYTDKLVGMFGSIAELEHQAMMKAYTHETRIVEQHRQKVLSAHVTPVELWDMDDGQFIN